MPPSGPRAPDRPQATRTRARAGRAGPLAPQRHRVERLEPAEVHAGGRGGEGPLRAGEVARPLSTASSTRSGKTPPIASSSWTIRTTGKTAIARSTVEASVEMRVPRAMAASPARTAAAMISGSGQGRTAPSSWEPCRERDRTRTAHWTMVSAPSTRSFDAGRPRREAHRSLAPQHRQLPHDLTHGVRRAEPGGAQHHSAQHQARSRDGPSLPQRGPRSSWAGKRGEHQEAQDHGLDGEERRFRVSLASTRVATDERPDLAEPPSRAESGRRAALGEG